MENRCCRNCLGEKLFSLVSPGANQNPSEECPYCHSLNQALVPVQELSEHFEWSREIYKVTNKNQGKGLSYWLREEWDIFKNLSEQTANQLLSDIFAHDNFSPSDLRAPENLEDTKKLDTWQRFKSEIQHQNRWVSISSEETYDLCKAFIDHLVDMGENEIEEYYYRARIHDTKNHFTSKDLGAPPQEIAGHGRLNPAGIPYLYLASLEKTAISEVRPHPGQNVVTAKFQIKSPESPDLKIADLIKFTPQLSPFEIQETDEILRLRTLYATLKRISSDFSRPISPNATPFEYVPTQYLCELIKSQGFDGAAYPSAVSDGHNIVLFDPSSYSAIEDSLREYMIQSISVSVEKI